MKKLVLSIALAPLLAACGGENTETAPPPAPSMTATSNAASASTAPAASSTAEAPAAPKLSMPDMQKKTLLAENAAFNAHDAKALGATYAQDAEMRMPSQDGYKDLTGRDAIVAEYDRLFTAVDVKLGVARVFQKGNVAMAEWVTTGTEKTGKKAGFRAISILWFGDDGLIKKDHTYFDMGTIAIQTGRAPGKARDLATLPAGDPQWVLAKNDDAETKLVDVMKNSWPVSWAKHDKKAYEASFTDDYVHEEIASPFDYKGKADALKELDMYVKATPDMAFSVDDAWAVGDVVVAEWTFKGTQKGALGPLKATNKPFTLHGADVDWFRGDKLAKASSYSNSLEFLTQVGAVKKPAPDAAAKEPGKKDDAKKDAAKKADGAAAAPSAPKK